MARADSRPLLPGIEIPTLVLVGEGDAITPPDVAREMAEMVEWASLVVVPESGHLSTLEQPERVNQALRLWLEPR
jgi:pimeloyl-ACP methyl ester carboxylesterase